jgi:hypothetical protein
MTKRLARQRGVIVVALLLMAVPLLYGVVTYAARSNSPLPWLEPAKSGSTCILPRAAMRYMHMNYLRILRDQVVRQGDRSQVTSTYPQGITSCRRCHENREMFCDKCHLAASVALDCFNCHTY